MLTSTQHRKLKDAIAATFQPTPALPVQWVSHADCREDLVLVTGNVLIYVVEGSFMFRFGDQQFEARKGQLAGIRKNVLLQYQASAADTGAACVVMTVRKETLMEFTKLASITTSNGVNSGVIEICKPALTALNCMRSLMPYFIDHEVLTAGLVRIKLLELLFCLSQSHQALFSQLLDIREHYRPDITAIVEENIMAAVSLTQLARLAGRSVSSFRRDFLAIYNMPPSRWIRQRRLEKAKELLYSTNMTVTHICYTMGFENLAHFSRAFKSYFGNSPSDLRLKTLVA
ncbi:AraC family transcriptional regulator [Flavihumibacter petaseus]|uniref:Putative AraC family transcriptional regulator n=1 Tax=Flavihumibacter petaseus NBRC 106054 TaxID=1220578 RepID=A0A0E9N2L3_9BACT|nr:AraC family transcriptional regulator [Flavihumibacter petaseus]GAO44084.1 putative AraC family transcriptional regulator [Flavihumibacter petaseus NBRC 106054]